MNQTTRSGRGSPSFCSVTVTNHPGPRATCLGGGPRGRGPSKSLGAPFLGPAATRLGGCPRWVWGDGQTPTRARVHADWRGLEGLWAVRSTVNVLLGSVVTISGFPRGMTTIVALVGGSTWFVPATVTYLQACIHTVRWGLERSRAVLGTVRRTILATVTYLQARIHTVRWGIERSRAVRDTVRRIGLVRDTVRRIGCDRYNLDFCSQGLTIYNPRVRSRFVAPLWYA
ncbi:hypothetical protein QAD02_007620 [Eretmocerus hayati]|uniref:Uncharacterized protein n=1 Tax=Eretmocerus hayati TaxID=131215 RepID=A0ACC2N5F0_9HYME|nr:hypothetical protein QAD02_007620 [Eretmocerus hayati]